MKYIFLVSGDFPDVAKAEIELFANAKIKEKTGNVIIAENGKFEHERLACTKVLCEFLFKCKKSEFLKMLESFDWNSAYRESFFVRIHHMEQKKAKAIADIIWAHLKNPKVSFESPKTEFDFIEEKGVIFAGKRIWENNEKFDARKAHKRPGFSPISLHPKLARAVVNLAGVKAGKAVLDPFCGTGGMLIEAGLMGLKPIGSDIDDEMLKKAEDNFKFFSIKKYELLKQDATKIKSKADGIATDPPYGKASSIQCTMCFEKGNASSVRQIKMKELYSAFLGNAYSLLKQGQRVAIIFPNKMEVKSRFKTLARLNVYIHKGLTRTINVLEK